jgi:membrane protein implicated in regulation of membrane protease activity
VHQPLVSTYFNLSVAITLILTLVCKHNFFFLMSGTLVLSVGRIGNYEYGETLFLALL